MLDNVPATKIGDRVTLERGERIAECVGIEYPWGGGGGGTVVYKYVSGDPPGDGHRMFEDRWRWLASGLGRPAGKKARPGVKVRQR